jgi:hypothetical protein
MATRVPWRPILAAIAALAVAAFCAVAAFDGAGGRAASTSPEVAAAAAPTPPPAVPAPLPAAAPVAAPAAPARAADPEEALTEQLRSAVDAAPRAALAIADQADAAFPNGRHAEERSWLRMRALVHLGDIGKARTVAGEFFERHPQSEYAERVWRLTGMSPRRIGPPT